MNNKFGMFVHFGPYALYGIHEQVLARGGLSHKDYEAAAMQFCPSAFDPDAWVSLAKEAGMEYLCFTAKHHDGFCMWDTAETDYSITHTPYGRDFLKELSEACHRQGMKLSIYYSLPDWHNASAYNPRSSHQWKAKFPEKADPAAYRAYVLAQVRELLTGYGELYTFFWDIPPMIDDPSVNALVRKLQPQILINNRGYDKGDFSTPERSVPDGSHFASMTEACQSVGEQSWGYRAEEDYYPAAFLMSSIDQIMARGGNYLLNVGPKPDGTIPAEAAALLRRIGRWYHAVRESLTDTAPGEKKALSVPDPYLVTEKNGTVWYHFPKGLSASAVTFSDPAVRVTSAVCLNTGEKLPVRRGTLPSRTDSDAVARVSYSSVRKIPVDALAGEPVILALTFA